MSHTSHAQTPAPEPDEDEICYDLAGNPLPARPRPAAIPPADSSPQAAPPRAGVVYAPPPTHTLPVWNAPAAEKPPRPIGLYVGLGIGAVVVILALVLGLRALKPIIITAPTAYKAYAAIDNTFSCDGPVGWKMHETGATSGSISTVSYELGAARVKVVSDAAGSLLSESFNAANANLPPEQQIPAVQKLHEQDEKQLEDSLTDYAEQPAQKIQTSFGESRLSEWTATGSAGALHGYRATMLGREREITVISFAPMGDWPVLQPAFQRIIHSVTPENGPS